MKQLSYQLGVSQLIFSDLIQYLQIGRGWGIIWKQFVAVQKVLQNSQPSRTDEPELCTKHGHILVDSFKN